MLQRTDQEWIHQLKQDDPQAMEDLWQLLFTYGTALARPYGIEDLGRDAAVIAYRRIMTRGLIQFRFECTFRGYCKKIVSNEVNRLLRRLLNEEQYLGEQDIDEIELPDENRNDHDNRSVGDPQVTAARIQPCLERLETREREVLDLRYLQGRNPEIVATHLGLTRNYVNVIAHRACLKVRNCLQQRGYQSSEDVWL